MKKKSKFSSSSSSSFSVDEKSEKLKFLINANDYISKLDDDTMHTILSKLSTEEAVKTSLVARRWVNLWKSRPTLEIDMRKLTHKPPTVPLHDALVQFAISMTKVIKEHRGDLESCIIYSFPPQYLGGMLESWINTVIRVKHTRDLTIENHRPSRDNDQHHALWLGQNTFTHPSFTSLSLGGFCLLSTHAFDNCSNLKILKLLDILIVEADDLTRVFSACSSLEVIVFEINCLQQHGVLKIVNNNLKFLKVITRHRIDKMEVHATCLQVLDVGFIRFERDDVIIDAPNIRFNRNYWIARSFPNAHLSYDISVLAQEKTSLWHELMVNGHDKRRHGSLSVSVDITNPIEVEILKEVLLMWSDEMKELEILFKNNDAPGEESGALWESTKPFPNADFRVHTVWIYNFNSSIKEEYALASCFVTQKTVTAKMMIETSKFSPMKKLKVEADVAKLREIAEDSEEFSIECF